MRVPMLVLGAQLGRHAEVQVKPDLLVLLVSTRQWQIYGSKFHSSIYLGVESWDSTHHKMVVPPRGMIRGYISSLEKIFKILNTRWFINHNPLEPRN